MSQTVVSRPFQNEKTNVLGELAIRFRKSSLTDEGADNYPPPPPVFQTYARQLAGDSLDHEVTSDKVTKPFFPTPTPIKSSYPSSKPLSNGSKPLPTLVPMPITRTPSSDSLKTPTKPMLTVPTKYIHKKCTGCHQPVITGGGYANGHLYHQECFKCYNCQCKLDTKFSSAQGNILCNHCFKLYQKQCSVCEGTISKDCVESNGKFYHSNCMKCFECKQVLDGMYFLLMGRFFCEKDYNKNKKKCFDCDKLIDGLYYTDNLNRTFCEADYKKKLGKCKRCSDYLEGNILKIPGASYHANCFKCKVCNIELAGGSVMIDDNKEVYCSNCYDQLFAEKCYKCKKPIVPVDGSNIAPRLRALNQNYHPECFKCEKCKLILEDGCYPADNKPFCYDCYENYVSSF